MRRSIFKDIVVVQMQPPMFGRGSYQCDYFSRASGNVARADIAPCLLSGCL
jgi:hypothetical protein